MNAAVTGLDFAPLVPLWALGGLAALVLALFLFGLWRRARGVWLRLLAAAALLFVLAGPGLLTEDREALSDVAVLLVDETDSQAIDDRDRRRAEAEAALSQTAATLDRPEAPLEMRVVRIANDPAATIDRGTLLWTALEAEIAEIGADRFAGAVVLGDGRLHDAPAAFPALEAPVHFLSTGRPGEYDRRLALERAPSFGLVGEEAQIRVRVEDNGATPADTPQSARISIRVNGREVVQQIVAVGSGRTLRAPLDRGGDSVVELIVDPLPGELTTRNNRAIFTIKVARDRLRVLLISGEPHAGERAWRNLLKADPSVDLVHFTILRPPEKQGGAAVRELSLIPFPTRELFMDKIDEFDLVIFDRYIRRGVLAPAYIQNAADYVRRGGAALIATGPAFAGPQSIYRSALAEIIPARPTGYMIEEAFRPVLTDDGARHPVTAALADAAPLDANGIPLWGRWLRSIEIEPQRGRALMTGPLDGPVLLLDRVEEGRVALLATDTAWLWSRGFEGGGPLAEMLRRVAHWLMKEPELEEEALTVTVSGATMVATRRSLETEPDRAIFEAPDGTLATAPFAPAGPGLWRATYEAEQLGLYYVTDSILTAIAAVGPPAPVEFENPVATDALLEPLLTVSGGAARVLIETGIPQLRRVSGAEVSGTDWIGLRERGAYIVRDARRAALAPGWLALLIAAALLLGAWRREGR